MRRKIVHLAVILVTTSVAPPLAALDVGRIERHIHLLVNRERAAQGLPAVALHAKLSEVARNHSQAMATQNFFSHTDPQGRNPFDRMRREAPEVKWNAAAENIAMNHGTDEETLARNLMTAWMNSSGHRANIMNRAYSHIGIGVAPRGSSWFATQVFAGGVTETTPSRPPETARVEPGVQVGKNPGTNQPATGTETDTTRRTRRYRCLGTNPDGSRYEGLVTITRRGNNWLFRWEIGRQTFQGRGREQGGVVTVDWGQQEPVIYRIQADGSLQGLWAGGKGSETLRPE